MSERDIEAHADHAMDQYRAELQRGKMPEEAAAWAANSEAESGGDPRRHQPGGPGEGLYQWGAPTAALDRRITFRRIMGIPVDQATPAQQRDFREWELNHTHTPARRQIDAARTPAEKARAIVYDYLQPRDKTGASADRARIADAIYLRAKMRH